MSNSKKKSLKKGVRLDENAPEPYGYEPIAPPGERVHFRVFDAHDDRIATCWEEGHAELIVRLMNAGAKAIRS